MSLTVQRHRCHFQFCPQALQSKKHRNLRNVPETPPERNSPEAQRAGDRFYSRWLSQCTSYSHRRHLSNAASQSREPAGAR